MLTGSGNCSPRCVRPLGERQARDLEGQDKDVAAQNLWSYRYKRVSGFEQGFEPQRSSLGHRL